MQKKLLFSCGAMGVALVQVVAFFFRRTASAFRPVKGGKGSVAGTQSVRSADGSECKWERLQMGGAVFGIAQGGNVLDNALCVRWEGVFSAVHFSRAERGRWWQRTFRALGGVVFSR